MKKADLILLYPDMQEQVLTPKPGISRTELEKSVAEMCKWLETGLLSYEWDGDQVRVFTSDKVLEIQSKMVKGTKVVDCNGFSWVIESDSPFVCAGDMCIRVRNAGGSDVCQCTFFEIAT